MKIKIYSCLTAIAFLGAVLSPTASAYIESSSKSMNLILNGGYLQMYSPEEESCTYADTPIVGAGDIPEAYDLRDYGLVTPVRNQGAEGMCHAFAAIGACETNLLKQGLETDCEALDLSEAQLGYFLYTEPTDPLDPRHGDYIDVEGKGAAGGNGVLAASGLASGYGTQYECYCDYDSWAYGYGDYLRYTGNYRLSQMNVLTRADTADKQANVKQWILESGGVSFAYYSQRSLYYDNGASYSYYAEGKSFYENANHAALIVGWDDNYSKENFSPGCQPANDGAWLVKNSYGVDLFDDGYFWLSYDDPSTGSFCRYIMESVNAFDDVYEYDGAGYVTAYTFDKTANVFVADYDSTLTDVSFHMPDRNPAGTTYKIELYRLTDDTSDPTDGTLISEVSGKLSSSGYFKISLDEAVQVKKGEQFSVVLAMTAPQKGQKVYLPIEETVPLQTNFIINCGSDKGESYVNIGGEWFDSFGEEGDYGSFGNIPIKVFAQRDEMTESLKLKKALSLVGDSSSLNPLLHEAEAFGESLTENGSSAAMKRSAAETILNYVQITTGDVQYPQYLYEDFGRTSGDSDGDGAITIADASIALSVYAVRASGMIKRLTTAETYAMDTVQNGKIEINDGAAILTMYAKAAVGT